MTYVRALAMLSMIGCSIASVGCKSVSPGGPGLPQAQITATPDLVGFTTSLDSAGSVDPGGRALTYSWRFASVPTGSTITNASLSAPTAAQTTFEPDLGGTYNVTLRVQAGDDVNEVTKAVVVPTWPVYFADGNVGPGGTQLSFNMIRSDGTGERPLSCVASTDMGGESGGDNSPLQAVAIAGFGTLATYESGDDPLIAYPQVAFKTDPMSGKFQPSFTMYVGSSRSDCMARPASRVDTLAPVVLGAGFDGFYLFTRFSPNGKRVAFVAFSGSGGPRLVTVGIDGRDMRVVAADTQMAPPSWIDDSTLAYLSASGAGGYIIKRAADMANAGPTATVVHDCGSTFSTIAQFEIRGTTVFMSAQPDRATAMTIHKNTLGSCVAAPFITTENGALAFDFTISPDGKTMMYSSSTGYPPLDLGGSLSRLTDIWSVPVDGSSPPKKIGGEPNLIDFGARFIANGRQIIWTQFATLRETDMGGGSSEPSSTSIWIANADGSKAHMLHGVSGTPPAGSYRLFVGGSHSGLLDCQMGDGSATVVGVAMLLAAVIALALRRMARSR